MTDQPQNRRKWRRRIAISLGIGFCAWAVVRWQSAELLSQAKSLHLGMTQAEVRQVLGKEEWIAPISSESGQVRMTMVYGRGARLRNALVESLLSMTGRIIIHPVEYPVELQFDDDGRLIWIRRGTEIMKASESPQR